VQLSLDSSDTTCKAATLKSSLFYYLVYVVLFLLI
jgi:hypothetical protein